MEKEREKGRKEGVINSGKQNKEKLLIKESGKRKQGRKKELADRGK